MRSPVAECGTLLTTLDLPELTGLLDVPDPVVRIHLGRSLDELRVAAEACVNGRRFESSYRFREAARAFLEARTLLGRYGLSP